MSKISVRSATHQGSKHIQFGINNQDCCIQETFIIPAFDKQYQVGIVSDGCTGIPGFSHTEVGSALLSAYAFGRIQELICSGAALDEIPRALFQALTEFIRDLAHKVMPPTILWSYPVKIKDREDWDSSTRFRADYLSATLLGFIADDQDLVVFSAGDGVILVNDQLEIIDQKDRPDYPANSINSPGKGFVTRAFKMQDVERLALASDGLKDLIGDPQFARAMFEHEGENPLGLQFLLNIWFSQVPEKMQDDCTVITLQKLED